MSTSAFASLSLEALSHEELSRESLHCFNFSVSVKSHNREYLTRSYVPFTFAVLEIVRAEHTYLSFSAVFATSGVWSIR